MAKQQQYSLAHSEDVEASAPPIAYSDDPQSSQSNHENGTPLSDVPYRDDPDGSIFDWGSGSSPVSGNADGVEYSNRELDRSDGSDQKTMEVANTSSPKNRRDSVSFAPLSLEDEDEDDLQDFSAARNANKRYLNVGGGWGRHGTSNKCYMLNRICLCHKMAMLTLGFIGIMFGFGYLGYQAGQSTDEEGTTKGQQWIEWMEHPKDHMHWPHVHHSSSSNNHRAFAPQTQTQLLETSNLIFHSCNEHSLSTSSGRSACLSACHGRICCFERESSYGSCIDEPYSYCYVYASCENALADFGMNNVNIKSPSSDGRLNEQDKAVLGSACSKDNIKTLEGIRDCNAFCMHHLCCFNGGGCGAASNVCDDYDACKVLVDTVVKVIDSNVGSDKTNNFSGGVVRPAPTTNTVNGHDFTYHDPDAIRASIFSACSFDPLANDNSWVTGCHAICADHLCCFGTPGTTSDCRQEPDTMCNAYAGCNVLLYQSKDVNHEEIKSKYQAHRPEMQPGSSETPDDIREVIEACNDNVFKDAALKKRCEEACSSRQCCFLNGPGNCYVLDTAWCDEFEACEVLPTR